jgi:hypothetical protein
MVAGQSFKSQKSAFAHGRFVGAFEDCRYKLLQAADAEEAYRRALELGAAEAHTYKNADGEDVLLGGWL